MEHFYYEYIEKSVDGVFLISAEGLIAAHTFKKAKHHLLQLYGVAGGWSESIDSKGIYHVRDSCEHSDQVHKRLVIWESSSDFSPSPPT